MVVGPWRWPWYQEAFAEALGSLGHEVVRFSSREYFEGATGLESVWSRLQERTMWGPRMEKLNRDFFQHAAERKPDVILVYNGMHIQPSSLRRVKRALPRTILAQYANDNPFSPKADFFLWRHLRHSVPLYDIHFAYRHVNLDDLRRRGAKRARLLRSYYLPEKDHRIDPGVEEDQFRSDVVFVGHYEADERLAHLEAVAATGARLRLFGHGWDAKSLAGNSPLRGCFPVRTVLGVDYPKALSGAKIALNFLSKLNGDTYTRRNFEIPACQTFALSEYSTDLASLFEEGKEAEFFRTRDEMLEKIRYYLDHDDERANIARNGYLRLKRDGHDVVSRAKEFLEAIRNVDG
jgi:hypothetical protein